MMNDDDDVVVARASGREAVEDLRRSGALDAFFERLDAGEFTWALSASVLVVPHMLIDPQYPHSCEAGGVIRCGLQARLDVGPHGVPRGS